MDNPEYIIKNMEIFESLYNQFMSITQSLRSKAGKDFESCLEQIFIEEKVDYDKQVFIRDDGMISRRKKQDEKGHVIDFISPKPKYPLNISEYKGKIISCKTSLRERVLQDLFLNTKNLVIVSLERFEKDGVYSVKIDKKTKELTKFIAILK